MIEKLDQTTQAILAADRADVLDAIESVRWERRGLLQRLVRIDQAAPAGASERAA